MSLKKKTVVSAKVREYQEEHLRKMEELFRPSRQEAQREEVQEAARTGWAQAAARQEELESRLSGFSQHLQRVEQETGAALVSQQAAFCTLLEESQEAWEGETRRLLEQHALGYETEVLRMHEQRQRELAHLEDELAAVSARHGQIAHLADEQLGAAWEMLRFLATRYDHERFHPGEAAHLEGRLEDAWLNLGLGAAEAALVEAQAIYRQASTLRVRLEEEELAWRTRQREALAWVRGLFDLARVQREVPPVDLEGQQIQDAPAVHVNFWAWGRLGAFLAEMKDLACDLETGAPWLDLPALNRLVEETLPEKERELAGIVGEALDRVRGSQLRVNIADLVIQSLAGQGYFLDSGAYEAGDQRLGFAARLRSYGGDEILVQVGPEEDEARSTLQLEAVHGDRKSAYQLKRSASAILGALKRSGLEVDGLQTVEDVASGDPEPAFRPQRVLHERSREQGWDTSG
jgi:hypothetical protein